MVFAALFKTILLFKIAIRRITTMLRDVTRIDITYEGTILHVLYAV